MGDKAKKQNWLIKVWNWLEKNDKQLIVIFTFLILLSAIWIGIVQNRISEKGLSIEGHAEIFAYPNSQNQIILINTGSKSLYLQKYLINGNETKINNSLIPPSTTVGFYYINLDSKFSPLVLQVFYADADGENYTTNITGIFKQTFWEIQTEPQKYVRNN